MKKRFAVWLPVLICMLMLFGMTTACAYTLGDVDGNDRVTASDARMTLRVAASLEQFTPEQEKAADVDFDGVVTATDARMILRVAASLDVFAPVEPTSPDSTTNAPTTVPPTEQLTPSDIHDMASVYTVEITAQNDRFISTGSGFFISDDGRVVTNFHVIEGTYSIAVTDYSGNVYPVTQILAYDADMDIAVLKIDAATTNAVLDYDTPKTGAVVYTLGSSDGLTDTFTNGIISNNARVDEAYNPNMTYYQITAPITHGNSGGPLINERGEVIGINTWTNTAGQNMNFAIPVRYLNQLDYSYPVTPEEFGGGGGGSSQPVSGSFSVGMSKIYLCPGGTACILLEMDDGLTNCDITMTANYDSDYVNIEWSDWYTLTSSGHDAIFLFISGLRDTSETTVFVSVKEAPQINAEISVDISPYGWEDYGGDPGFPDFGAFVGAAPYLYWISDEADAVAYQYYLYDVFAAGADVEMLTEDFPKLLSEYGFYLIESGFDEDGDYTMQFMNYAVGTMYLYSFIYDDWYPDTITDILVMLFY